MWRVNVAIVVFWDFLKVEAYTCMEHHAYCCCGPEQGNTLLRRAAWGRCSTENKASNARILDAHEKASEPRCGEIHQRPDSKIKYCIEVSTNHDFNLGSVGSISDVEVPKIELAVWYM